MYIESSFIKNNIYIVDIFYKPPSIDILIDDGGESE